MTNEIEQDADLATLERFVVDNDDLLELEERIGRFNIFDALRIVDAEIRHSNFLAWLLDPNESHGTGPLFLNAILMDLLRESPTDRRPFSPVELDGAELRGVTIRREWANIDILITCEEPRFVIAIENKVRAGEHSEQLERYKQLVRDEFANVPAQFVFLTRDGDEPTDQDWTIYTYESIHRAVSRVRRANNTSIGADVQTFLDHYLRMIGSRFMDDPKIDELCQRIYTNHRQALELIWERAGGAASAALIDLHQMLKSDPHWHVFNRTSKRIDFVPRDWLEWIPPISARPKTDPQMWIRWWFLMERRKCALIIEVGPARDPALRRRVIERLIQDADEFGFKMRGTKRDITESWSRLFGESIATWDEDSGPDGPSICKKAAAKLQALRTRLEKLPAALRPIIDNWQSTQVSNTGT